MHLGVTAVMTWWCGVLLRIVRGAWRECVSFICLVPNFILRPVIWIILAACISCVIRAVVSESKVRAVIQFFGASSNICTRCCLYDNVWDELDRDRRSVRMRW